jgi:hypothetical protein
MLSSLVAAVALGFVGEPSSGVLTDVQQANRWLLVGTWEHQGTDGIVEVWEFRRNGQFTVAVHDPDGGGMADSGTYRVDGQRVKLDFRGVASQSMSLVQLDRRVLVWDWCGPTRYRRR